MNFAFMHLPDPMQVEDFLNIPDENIVYEILDENQIIEEIVDMYKTSPNEENHPEGDDSAEVEIVSVGTASKSLKTVRTFLLQQEGATEYIELSDMMGNFINIFNNKIHTHFSRSHVKP